MLADLSLDELATLYPEPQLAAFTDRTPTSLSQLKALIDVDRRNGFGVSQGGFEAGISTLAAPVFNGQHRVVATVSVTVPAQTLSDDQLAQLLPQVQQAANQLTARIHHQAHAPNP